MTLNTQMMRGKEICIYANIINGQFLHRIVKTFATAFLCEKKDKENKMENGDWGFEGQNVWLELRKLHLRFVFDDEIETYTA